tara:strand:- start:1498 stop:1836 length:339 start_codon:yes stop_codon:yes gene_type:complete
MIAMGNSGIKDKAKLREYLYKNPRKLALKLAKMVQTDSGELLQPVKLKGKGAGYYYSLNDKKMIMAQRDAEFYLLPWVDYESDRCYVYSHYSWQIGVILKVFKDQIEQIGFN